MIYTFTANPSIDYIIETNIVPNTLNRSKSDRVYPGGKGINVSLMLTNLGCENIAIVPVAGPTGAVLENLLKPKLKAAVIRTDGVTRVNTKAIGKDGVTEINGRGISPKIGELLKVLKKIQPDDILVISGSFADYSLLDEIVHAVDTKKIVFDIPDIEYAIKHKPFVIKPNLSELERCFGTAISPKEVDKYAIRIRDMGCRNVLVSMGADGAYFCNKNYSFYVPAPLGESKGGIGAGDSMTAGLVYSIENTIPVENAAALAAACGSATAFKGCIADRADVEMLYGPIEKNGGIPDVRI
ncbi:MAG: 1-phosphofructokinase [Firmicutes bacterium]|nr:1-phosphofructokinase [Bacillota bacterium]